ncbi:MAG: DUF1732 domain-containing protein, partial [Bacteroidia bacterium]|nr:DUF1732 domain-containing protein [Bacteroidia bacterium]
MIKSMTGYGKAEAQLDNGKLTIEFRSVNGKNADISIKSSLIPKDKEMEIRKRIADSLQRGTIDMFVTWEPNAAENAKHINQDLAMEYFKQIEALGEKVGAVNLQLHEPNYLISTILRLPDVIDAKKQDIITENNWPLVDAAINEALANINDYRAKEGAALYNDVTSRVAGILSLENEVESYEGERIDTVKARIMKNLEELQAKVDKERFEQEMIYYLEKLDINEEKVRLRQHCQYFMDTIDGEPYPGKKLGFIIQEMGREINTTGSKANHASIQKC